MDFSLSPQLLDLQQRTRDFINRVVIPAEPRVPQAIEDWQQLRGELQQAARDAGIFAPHIPREYGGLGLNWRECSVIFEEAGRSLLGPQALNCAAPDEGNMHMLEKIASPAQKEKYLRPLAQGATRSCFAMTEPDGAGADPSLLKTRAEYRDGKWFINGRKWFISGAIGASFAICMARTTDDGRMTNDDKSRDTATMFLVDASNPGFRVIRKIPTLDLGWPGGHAQVEFVDCCVDDDAVLGAVNEGFEYAQVRLGPARLTHCMRWLGAARRALEYALVYARERESFGKTLSEHEGVQFMVADSEIEMHAARLMIWHAAYLLDMGEKARHETSMAKVFVAETVNRVIDRAVQICGARGIAEDWPLAALYRENRAFRIYDGPSEVHRMSVARRVFRRVGQA
ncbi:MAG TPA: acyl-CoA dehydrogenase family protein [Anaerolineae bacterium]|nr:acyl-CoA dehydrogenase family protein [Anaerolineae bacterium]